MRTYLSCLPALCLACASSSSVPSEGPSAGPTELVHSESSLLQRTAEKTADDERVASLAADRMVFRRVVIPSSDGLPIPAYLFEPQDLAAAPRAAVLFLHGGEHGTFGSRSVPRVEGLVQAGFVVLAPDYRGSSGYSQEFHDSADYGGKEIDDVIASRDWLVARGYAAEGRVGVLGSSHGGYNALLAAARSPEDFDACVDFFGPTDLVYRVTSTPAENPNAAPGDPEKFARMVGATVEQDLEAYRSRSPRFVAAMIRAPLLIVHGTDDGVVDIRESEWLVSALREAGHADFRFLPVEGADHGHPSEAFAPAWEEVLLFLSERLQSR